MLYKRILHSSYIFQHIIDNMHDGVLTIDDTGTITTFNPAAEKILDIDKKNIINKKYSNVFIQHPENDAFNQTVLDAVYESSMSHHKICTYFNGNTIKSLFVTTSFLKITESDESEVVGVTVVFSDITELQELRDASVAMDKIKHLNQQLERLSYLDVLTGLPNLRYFIDARNREWRRSIRENTELSLIMLDIDYFKQNYDTFGHQAGDDCLVSVAQTLSQTLRRPGDLIARYGGDEFVVILPHLNKSDATHMAEMMRQAVMDLNIKNPGSPYKMITISLGIACQRPSLGNHPNILLKAADEALYRGKEKGRNFVSA
ncbi:MAG: diguanylate cyclase [Bacillota bacterium]|nr:diguanylate cyclase [Bacillota bacterium]